MTARYFFSSFDFQPKKAQTPSLHIVSAASADFVLPFNANPYLLKEAI